MFLIYGLDGIAGFREVRSLIVMYHSTFSKALCLHRCVLLPPADLLEEDFFEKFISQA